MPRGVGAKKHPSRASKVRRATRAALRPAFGLTFITPLVLAGAVGATPRSPSTSLPLRNAAVTPLAAVNSSSAGPSVVAVPRAPASLHVAAGALSATPAAAIYAPGTLGIPKTALAAYRNAERQMSVSEPECGISWNLLAGIGRIESGHANGGATDVHGTVVQPIYGPSLDGSLPGNEVIVANSTAGKVVYARAMGPMQFLPGTWARYASDGDGDGKADPQNVYDAALAAARYLCTGGLNLREQSQVLTAILRYNNSMAYAENVMGWASAYATGVAPVDLPPIVGPAPPIADLHLEHLEHPEGLGPGSPLNLHGLTPVDPSAGASLIDLGQGVAETSATQPANMPWLPPWLVAAQQPQQPRIPAACRMICLDPQVGMSSPGPAAGATAPDGAPEAPGSPLAPMPPYAVAPADGDPAAPQELPPPAPQAPAPQAPAPQAALPVHAPQSAAPPGGPQALPPA